MILHNYSTHILSFFVVGLFFPIMSVSAISTLGTDFVGTTTNTDFLFQQNNVERMRLTGSGVRISTVGGYLDYRPNNVPCANGQILSWDSTNTRWTCTNDALGIAGSGLVSNYLSKWNGTTLINSTIFDNGTNVGIGTNSPDPNLLLQIASSSIGLGARAGVTNSNKSNFTYLWSGFSGATNDSALVWNSVGNIRFGTETSPGIGFSEKVRITTTGNVGIGTVAPTQLLTVAGARGLPATTGTTQNGMLRVTPSASDGGTITLDMGVGTSGVNNGWLQVSDRTALGTNYSLALNPNGGNVGIGTSNPTSQTEIQRIETTNRTSYNDVLSVTANATTNPYSGHGGGILFRGTTYRSGVGNVNYARIGSTINDHSSSTDGSDLFFDVSPLDDGVLSRAMTIKFNGNVGIGTVTPGQRLDVSGGSIRTTNQLISTLATGTAPLAVTSTTRVANLNVATAGTADQLTTARTIGGVSFDGTANINLPGVNTAGNQNTTGNAATATALQNARTIAGVSFNGTANIDIPFANLTARPTTVGGYGITDAVNTTGDQTIGGNKTFTGDVIVQGKVVTDTLVNRTVQNLTISGSLYPYSTSSSKDLGATGNRWNNGFFGGNIAAGGWVGAGCEGECEGGGGYSLMYPNGTIVATTSVTAPSFIGNATTATTASAVPWSGVTSKPTTLAGYGITDFISSNASNPVAADAVTTNGNYYVNANIGLFGQTDGALYSQAYGPSWVGQIYQDYRTGQIALRGKNNGVWQAWRTNLDSGNYTSYAPSLTGGGASGTWGINITGNAATASAVPWSGVTGKPTTLAGYGITDAVNTTGDQTIGGNKTFTGDVIVGGATDSPLTLNKSSGTQWNYMQWNYGGVRRYWQGLDSTGQYNIRPDSSTGTILLGGRVGIGGTSTPLGTLDVYGDIAFSNNVTQPANNFARIFQEAGVGPMIAGYQFGVKTGGSGTSAPIERLRIDPSGNVGIGTTSPGERLHVNGNAIFSGTISANTPIASNHVATKAYVDAAVSAGGGDDHTIVLTTLSNNPSAGLLCGLDAAGRAYCYGGNRDFQNYPVGESANKYNGSLSGVLLPILGHLRFSAIYGNCGVTTSGRLYCWDKDSKNQLSMYEPGIVEGIDRDIQPILISSSGITISKLFSFGSKTSDPYGSTGVGGGTNCIISSTNKLYCVGGQSSLEYGYYYPRGQGLYLITGSLDFSDMATRHYTTNATSLGYTCGITTTGSGYCWGNKTLNTAGRGGTPVNDILPLGEISGGHRFSKIALGGLTDCGLTLSGAAYCWGSDHEYALGDDGAISNIYTPVAVNAGGLTFSDIVISTDWHKVCGLANSGSIYCWGDNEYLPTLKSGTGVYTKIVAAKDVVCGLSSIGTIDCTGSNNPLKRGFLGNGYTDLVVFRNDTVCGKTIDNLTYCFTSRESGSISDFNLISPYDRWDSPSRYHGR